MARILSRVFVDVAYFDQLAGVMRLVSMPLEEESNLVRGLDSRYMISQLKPPNVKVLSLTTIATPHRGMPSEIDFAGEVLTRGVGSEFADYCMKEIGSKLD